MKSYKHLLNYGTISGLLAFGVFLFLYMVLGVSPFGLLSWVTVIIPMAFMYFGIKKYREEERDGYLNYGQGFTAGMLYSFVYASLSGMLVLLFGTFVDAGFLEVSIQEKLQGLGESKELTIELFGKSVYESMLIEMKSMTVSQLALGDFQSKLFGSIIIALVVSGILINRPPVLNDE